MGSSRRGIADVRAVIFSPNLRKRHSIVGHSAGARPTAVQPTLQVGGASDQHVGMNHGSEWTQRIYRKEEEFLEEWYETVDAVLPLLGGEWRPNYVCNERERQRRQYALAAGQLEQLTFDGAAIFYAHGQLSSLQIELRSSRRVVFVRIWWEGGQVTVEKILDMRPHRTSDCAGSGGNR
jgi:hypothetical protein